MSNWQLSTKKIKMQKIWNLISLFMLLLTTVFVQAQEGTAKTGLAKPCEAAGGYTL